MKIKLVATILAFCGALFAHAADDTLQKAAQDPERLWVDVRSLKEKQANGIEGDGQVEWQGIVEFLSAQGIEKDRPIALYCRSGNRSGMATQLLAKAGYTDVINAGSVGDARKLRGL
ncbi:rhodanese-like domain-containing protein [Parendozoicomonas haliclonae]|uniref:Thiosulfate sulfurtransferase PspE n=1 Tax=Parendozoicomonas haliclonae TaxID=1960125 RepID=A0A1X7AH93_9GAMM|nr:rhodanese-like domain-containing protein [Parendozoicomonas haliclonae]SMA42190.1 Thiosulfate sulfurtransferase PspE precursor [Parendozoicomonas haliclonae]